RPGRIPADAGAPVVVAEHRREREQQQRHHDLDGAVVGDRGRVVLRRGRILDDDFYIGVGHLFEQSTLVTGLVMPGLAPGIHVLLALIANTKTWMAGTSPAMTQ